MENGTKTKFRKTLNFQFIAEIKIQWKIEFSISR